MSDPTESNSTEEEMKMRYESKPVKDWTYRNIDCVLYCLRIPDDSRWVGYVRIGDEWTEVLDTNGTDPTGDPERMVDRVEDEVDSMILDVVRDRTDGMDIPVDPGPNPDPNPGPNLNPNPGPYPRPDPDPFDSGTHFDVVWDDLDKHI